MSVLRSRVRLPASGLVLAATLASGAVACERPPEPSVIAPEPHDRSGVEHTAAEQTAVEQTAAEQTAVDHTAVEHTAADRGTGEPPGQLGPPDDLTEPPLAPRAARPEAAPSRARAARAPRVARAAPRAADRPRRRVEAVSQDRPGSMYPGEAPIRAGEPADDVSRRAREVDAPTRGVARDVGATTVREATRPIAPERPRDAPVVTPAPTSPVTIPAPTSPLPPF